MDFDRLPEIDTILIGIIVLFAAALVVIPIADHVLGWNLIQLTERPYNLKTSAQVANAIGSIILTLGLVIFYREQNKTQKQQETWMQAEHEPDISIDSWSVNGNEVTFEIANLGDGGAKNIRVTVEIKPITRRSELPRLDIKPATVALFRDDINSDAIRGSQIETRRFSGFPELTLRWSYQPWLRAGNGSDWRESTDDVSTVLRTLSGWGIETIEYTVNIEFEHVKRFEGSISVYGAKVDITGDMGLEALTLQDYKQIETDLNLPPNP